MMQRRDFLRTSAGAAFAASALHRVGVMPSIPTWSSFSPAATDDALRDDRMQWWRDARFGMFVHWGLYAILAGEWHGKTNYGEWIRNNAKIPVDEYESLLARWQPDAFDADAVA